MNDKNKKQLDVLTESILEKPDIILFHDQKNTPYARIPTEHSHEIIQCSNTRFSAWCKKFFYDQFNQNFGNATIKDVISLLEAQAMYSSPKYKLYNRIAFDGYEIRYNLCNELSQVIQINEHGWSIQEQDRPLFKKETQQKEQVLPERCHPSDINLLFDFVNIQDPDQKILFPVWLVTSFIPGIIHPLAYVYGPQGSAKSTISKIVRDLIDPSLLEVTQLPKSESELTQQLDHNYMVFYDNVSFINHDVSDLLCRAITGMGVSKRKLYTDNEDVIYNFKSTLGINGINLVGAQPDLLERSILFPLERMPDEKRCSEVELWKKYEEVKPRILGAIFSILSTTLLCKDSLGDYKNRKLPRMADFAIFGCAAAQSMRIKPQDFLAAYNRNIESQTEEAINNSDVAVTIREFMKDKETWQGTPRDLYNELDWFLADNKTEIDLPKNEASLGRKISDLEVPLSKIGIIIKRNRNQVRTIEITNTKYEEKEEDESDIPF